MSTKPDDKRTGDEAIVRGECGLKAETWLAEVLLQAGNGKPPAETAQIIPFRRPTQPSDLERWTIRRDDGDGRCPVTGCFLGIMAKPQLCPVDVQRLAVLRFLEDNTEFFTYTPYLELWGRAIRHFWEDTCPLLGGRQAIEDWLREQDADGLLDENMIECMAYMVLNLGPSP